MSPGRNMQPGIAWHSLASSKTSKRVVLEVKSVISTFFMLLVGMSMPSLFTVSGHLTAGQTAMHVFVVSVLMVLGKMMLLFCYRKEADLKTRLALSLGNGSESSFINA